jgi:hypothetical protein
VQYALLIYGHPSSQDNARPIDPAIADVLTRPAVIGWARLSATTRAGRY